MSVTINPIIDHETYEVNGKTVYQDSRGEWISKQELSSTEWNAFRNYKIIVIENKAFKKHSKSIYKTK
jgi:hypothetical protein